MDLSLNMVYSICLKALKISDKGREALPLPIRWRFERNLEQLVPIAEQFENIKIDARNKFFGSDEKSEAIVDESGNSCRKIKDEYIEEYKKKMDAIAELGSEIVTVNIKTADIDALVDSLDDDSPLTFEDLDCLAFMNK